MDWEESELWEFGSIWGDINDPAFLDRLERRFWMDLWRAPVVDAIEEQRIEMRFYGPIQAMVMPDPPQMPLLNLVLGAGELGAVGEGHLGAAIEWVESLGVDCRIPIAPGLEAGAAEDLLNQRGYRRSGYQVRFTRDAEPPDFPKPPGIEIVELDEFTEGFSDYVEEGFDLALMATCFFDGLPGREMWRCYVALDEDETGAASAVMMRDEEVALLGFAATRESARGSGFHLALLRRRIHDAHNHGCRLLVAETEESLDELDGPSPAARNLVRVGFKQVASRPVWRPT